MHLTSRFSNFAVEETGKAAAPACFVIALVSLALFYDAVGDFSKALAVVNEVRWFFLLAILCFLTYFGNVSWRA